MQYNPQGYSVLMGLWYKTCDLQHVWFYFIALDHKSKDFKKIKLPQL